MSRQELIEEVKKSAIEITNSKETTTIDLISDLTLRHPHWKILFDAPDICEYDTPLTPESIDKMITEFWWDSSNQTHEQKVQAVITSFNKEKLDAQNELKSFYKLKKIKVSDRVYSEVKIDPNRVNNVLHLEGCRDWDPDHIISKSYRGSRFNRHRNNNKDEFGFLLHTMNRIPDLYVVMYQQKQMASPSVLFYKKTKNLKLENESIEALRLIEDVTNRVSFFAVFPPNGRVVGKYGYEDKFDYELLGKFHTKTYAHSAVNILSEIIQSFENPMWKDRILQLVGLGATSYRNRLAQYYLQDNSLDIIQKEFNYHNTYTLTEDSKTEAINILESRYQSYKASQLKKKAP